MRRESLNITPIEALARLDEIKIMLLELPLLHWLLLPLFVAKLYKYQLDPPSTTLQSIRDSATSGSDHSISYELPISVPPLCSLSLIQSLER
jgi:hypothetical protein